MATKTGTKGSQTFARCLLLTAAALGIVELVLYLLEGRTSFAPNYSVYAIVGMGLGIALIALHTAEYFHIGRRIAAEHGLRPAEGLLNCLAYGFTWWLPLERGE